jgi:hypothetical protein
MSQPRRFALTAGAGLFALFALHAALNHGLPVPQIHADEGGYLGDARYLASGYGRSGVGYYAGYSLFLVPAAWLTSSALAFYHAALFTNAVLAVAAPLLALILTRVLFPSSARWVAIAVAGVVAFSPLVFAFGGLAMSENALIPATLGTAILVALAARSDDLRVRLGAVAAGVFAYWISPRGVIVTGATIVALAVVAVDRRRAWYRFAPELLVGVGGLVLGTMFERAANGTADVAGIAGREHGPLWAVIHLSAWRLWLGAIIGRFAYLGAASAGLTIIGLVVAAKWIRPGRSDVANSLTASRRAVAVFASLAVIVTLVADAASVASSQFSRLDLLYYGRYTEAVCMPMLVIGAARMLSARVARRAAVASALVGLGVVVAAITVPLLVSKRPANSTLEGINVMGVYAIRLTFDVKSMTLTLLVAAAVGTAVVLLAVLWNRAVGSIALVALLAASSFAIHSQFEHDSKVRATEGVLGHVVSRLGSYGVPTTCVSLDEAATGFSRWHSYNYRFLLPSTRFQLLDKPPALPCGPLTISTGLGFGTAHPTTRLVAIENNTPMSLWIDLSSLPGAVRERAVRAGLFFPGSPCRRLPADAYRAGLSVVVQHHGRSLSDLDALRLSIDIAHDGGGAPWLGTRAIAKVSGCGRVEIATSVIDGRGKVVYKHTIATPRSLLPGERAHVVSGIVGPDAPVPSLTSGGPYTLNVVLVQEGVRFFGGADQQGVSIPLGRGTSTTK